MAISVHSMAIVVATVVGAATFSDSAFASPGIPQQGLSAIDTQREDAASVFGVRLEALRLLTTQVADDQRRYNSACRGKVTTIRPRVTPGVPLDRLLIGTGAIVALGTLPLQPLFPEELEMKNETTAVCRVLWSDVAMRSALIKKELAQIDEEARRRGVYPGVMRDLRAKYGFGLQSIVDFR
jgi:hypothetical protein